ncbi:MAG: prephenate dehydrogenase/arogenate dehydrogenase family protein [Deltaproteobacteria bacterium HGW-Deltaproteobacteria-4]|nr:MAG: prephenate dehydrogenase/arogenate dehydrogenase family protein [Deltaproteobacteria bacterium HGW-Deltaproteobacteria-4]
MKNKPLHIPVVAIIGVGLIGGSLALALKAAGVADRVLGYDLDAHNLEQALQLGVIDQICISPEELSAADLIFLATPVLAMPAALTTIAPYLKTGAILTDGGSVKAAVISVLEPLLPAKLRYVPGHPISGTERNGATAAFATLYRGKRCILTPTERTDPQALDLVTALWQAAGSEVIIMDAEKHDRILAAISHLPHMVAYALVNAVGAYDRYEENILLYSAGGFRDFTRIASSDPTMWRDIALTNREALLEMIERFEADLAGLKEAIRIADAPALHSYFLRSKLNRDAIL